MRQAFKWPGFALVALGITVFPFVIWLPGPWGVLSLVMIMIGCVLLVLSLRGGGLMPPHEHNEERGDEPGEAGKGGRNDGPPA